MREATETIWELIGLIVGVVLLVPALAVLSAGVMALVSWAVTLIGRL